MQARHVIMRNDLYIACGQPATWKNEMKLEVKGHVTVIAEALFIRERRYHIVEVDHTQKMGKNRTKLERYRKLIDLGVFEKLPFFL